MKILFLNLKELKKILEAKAEKNYAIAVIDNYPPSDIKLPLIAPNFIWIKKTISIPTQRKELEKLFSRYGLEIGKNQPIAIFHHHDLPEPYLHSLKEKIEYYEFSHTDSIAYIAFYHADANLLSHILTRTFHKYDKVILVKSNLSQKEIEKIKTHWAFNIHFEKTERFNEEELLIYHIALKFTGNAIIPDPGRYKPEVHDELINLEIPTDQYAIPALFKNIDIKTGTKLDKKFSREMKKLEKVWRETIETLKKRKEN